ncbi:MAG: hypothetical protein U1F07_05180 [Rubrivivax sp.]
MREEVFVRFAQEREFELPLSGHAPLASDEARRWLDEQFVANDCEPLRASGKVLTADKVLALAAAVGAERFAQDAAWAAAFARAVTAALGRPVVRVDVEASSVTF